MYVAFRKDSGYVARRGVQRRWTKDISKARIYARIYDAEHAGDGLSVTVYEVQLTEGREVK